MLRLRVALWEFLPAALEAFAELSAAEALELLGRAPDPVSAARLTTAQITAARKCARRHQVADRAQAIRAALAAEHLTQPDAIATAYAATVRAQVAILVTLNTEITRMQEQVEAHLAGTRTLRSTAASPASARSWAPGCLPSSATTPPAPPTPDPASTPPPPADHPPVRQEAARAGPRVDNDRLIDALPRQAYCARTASAGARAYSNKLRGRGVGHHAALGQLANRLVGILHGCLKTGTRYDEATAWSHREPKAAAGQPKAMGCLSTSVRQVSREIAEAAAMGRGAC